jgi:hypothetical protein
MAVVLILREETGTIKIRFDCELREGDKRWPQQHKQYRSMPK